MPKIIDNCYWQILEGAIKCKPQKSDLAETRTLLVDLNCNAPIPECQTLAQLLAWRRQRIDNAFS